MTTSRAAKRHCRGNSFGSCLLMLVLVLGGTMWAYYHFFENKGLRNGGAENSITVDEPDNRVAELEYQRMMRERLLNTSEYKVTETNSFYRRALATKYKDDPSGFEQRYFEVLRDLRENLDDVNSHKVPPRFVKGHLKLGWAHRHCYEALVLVRKGYYEEPDVQKASYKEADHLLKQAWGEVKEGQALVRAGFR